tara:strand:- start:1118 stop:1294 length:177 start_codon:yes stop_codon:yes gene_type:complete
MTRSQVSDANELGSFPRIPMSARCIPNKTEAVKPNPNEVKKFLLSLGFKDEMETHIPL